VRVGPQQEAHPAITVQSQLLTKQCSENGRHRLHRSNTTPMVGSPSVSQVAGGIAGTQAHSSDAGCPQRPTWFWLVDTGAEVTAAPGLARGGLAWRRLCAAYAMSRLKETSCFFTLPQVRWSPSRQDGGDHTSAPTAPIRPSIRKSACANGDLTAIALMESPPFERRVPRTETALVSRQ
jgi:hypothetical protein